MNGPFLPFALPDIGEEEIDAVCQVLRSGWITTGPKTKEFEENFRSYLGDDIECLAVNSATAGLHLALEALGVGPGDEVIVPSLTFTATAEAVSYLGANVVIVDVDPNTLNISPDRIRAAITPNTKVVIPVHYAGLPCDMDSILQIAQEFNLKVVEDAAHALSSVYKGVPIGCLQSDVTVFSFYANKTMTTGEGGMVVTRSSELASRIRIMRLHGISRDAFDRFTSRKPSWYYEIVASGFKYNLTDIASAIGIQQLKKLSSFLERRNLLAASYISLLADFPFILPPTPGHLSTHAWHLFVIRLLPDFHLTRDQVISKLSQYGIGTSVHYVPLHRQPHWMNTYSLSPQEFPATEQAFSSMISLPLYTKMSDSDQQRVVSTLQEICSNAC